MSQDLPVLPVYEKRYIGVHWCLLEYVSPEPAGREGISDWRDGMVSVSRKASMDTFLRNMVKKPKWSNPEMKRLSGKHLASFFELRWKSDNVPHRIGGYFTSNT